MRILEELALWQKVWRVFQHLMQSGQKYSLSWLQMMITTHELLLFGNYDIGMKHCRIGMKYFFGQRPTLLVLCEWKLLLQQVGLGHKRHSMLF
jgi:hypothetical protein